MSELPERAHRSLKSLMNHLRQERSLSQNSSPPVFMTEGLHNPSPGLPWSLRVQRKQEGRRPSGKNTPAKQELILNVEHPDLGAVTAVLGCEDSYDSCRFYSTRSQCRQRIRKNLRTLKKRLKEKGFGTVRMRVLTLIRKKDDSRGSENKGVSLWG